jgi:hypothetical protein
MDDFQTMWLSQEDLIFNRLLSFHRRRVDSLLAGSPPLCKPENGFIVVHLIPEDSIIGRTRFEGSELKARGSQIPALGQQVGYRNRLNADGLIELNGSEPARAFSQLSRAGWLESAMSDLVHKLDGNSILRVTSCEQGMFWLVDAYLHFCKDIGIKPPIWLFATLVNCHGARLPTHPRWMNLSEAAIDRSLAHLPEMKITSYEDKAEKLLRPLCDSIWQAAGVERSLSYDKDGNWHEPR